MFCPQCRTEYRPGIARCPECGVDLVEQLPQGHDEAEWVEFVPVLESTDETRLEVARSLLDAEGIPCLVQAEEGQAVIPAGPVRLCVRPEDEEAALALLEHLEPLDTPEE